MNPKLLSSILSFVCLAGCSHPALLGRIGDDLDRASPYALCRAQTSIVGSPSVNDAIARRGIDCSQYAAAIAANRAAGVALGNSIMQNAPKPVIAPPVQPQRTTCNKLGYTAECTTY